MDNIELEFEKDAICEVAKIALERKTEREVLELYLKMLLWTLCLNCRLKKMYQNVSLQKMLFWVKKKYDYKLQ